MCELKVRRFALESVHEWLIEFETLPDNLGALEQALDQAMIEQNIYYSDLIEGKIDAMSLYSTAYGAELRSRGVAFNTMRWT